METKLKIDGMHCAGCVSRVKAVLESEAGVRQADVSLEAGEATVEHNEHSVEVERLTELVEGAGYTASAVRL